jgi:hypothetical protein
MTNGLVKFLFIAGLLTFIPAFAGQFPNIQAQNDVNDILDVYPTYLQFVVEVGREVDNSNTQRLIQIFNRLKKQNPTGAALFLKGLRFEVVQKVELMGSNPSHVNTRTPEIRRFVGRYMKEWVREADEHLFRSVSTQITKSE